MRVRIIEKGARELAKKYRDRGKNLRPATESWLRNEATYVVRSGITQNFATESDDGKKWKRLARETVEERISLGYGGEHPILMRTGRLLRMVLGQGQGSDNRVDKIKHGYSLKFMMDDAIGRELHFGNHKRALPARPFMTLTSKASTELRESYRKVLYNKK